MAVIKRQRIVISGRVQGVGFRPAVYRIATQLTLAGFVYNDTKGVTIELQGLQANIKQFLDRLQNADRPPLATIKSCVSTDIPVVQNDTQFIIRESERQGSALSEVTPDIAACSDCLSEMEDKNDFLYRYPFTNCTNCGPRYSIVKTIPYDRPNTTMSVFKMCSKCSSQYRNIADRRFHAQPVACPQCGPKIWLADSDGKTIEIDRDKVISKTAELLRAGKIAAIKGVGGFHLAVDALNNEAVLRLRERKKRDYKPFAMMASSIGTIKKYATVLTQAEQLLKSPQSPIVLLPKKEDSPIASSVVQGLDTLGFMLCYAPLHHLLFAEEGIEVLVMTSGNISDEPLICKNKKAIDKLGKVADVFLMHDREIYRQVDDSIMHFIDGEPAILRRARGYVPMPFLTVKETATDIFAAGPDLKNTFCFAKQNQLILSEHIGDLEDGEVYHHYIESIKHLAGLFEVKPKVVVCDLHPNYLSTRYAMTIPADKRLQVQHHWAHIASVLAEYNLDEPVIGIAADGTGYGTDGAVWGCECLIASLDKFERFGHLSYYKLAGADKASKEAIRPLLGLLKKTFQEEFDLKKLKDILEPVEPDISKLRIITEQLEKEVNTVETSSLGRIFDAVAAMLGLGNFNHFEAQLPMALEAATFKGLEEAYDFEIIKGAEKIIKFDITKMMTEIIDDIRNHTGTPVIAAKFANCLAAGLLSMAKEAREATGIQKAAISGGVFCNRYLTNRLIRLLNENEFKVLFHKDVPANDGGIALGQAAIAVKICRK